MRCGEWTETRIIGPIAKAKPKGRISAFYRLALLFPRRDQASRTRREGTTLRRAGQQAEIGFARREFSMESILQDRRNERGPGRRPGGRGPGGGRGPTAPKGPCVTTA